MNKTSRRRVAAVATTATMGALLLPFASAGIALAAEPTGITATPTTQTVAVSGAATITATLTGPTVSNVAHGVYYRVTAGPDATTGNTGKACTLAPANANTYTCMPTGNTLAGTDTFQVFYDAAGGAPAATANFQNGDPTATASVTYAGAATKSTITPTTSSRSTDSTAVYSVGTTDVNGTPATGTVSVSISQTVPTGTPNPLLFTDPTVTTFPATAGGTGTGPVVTSVVVGTNTTFTSTQTFTLAGGAASVGIASSVAGTVSISGGTNSTVFTAGTASLSVSQGNVDNSGVVANNDRAVKLTQAAGTTSFINKTVSNQVTVTNAAGDPLGGVSVRGAITAGPNATSGTNGAPAAVTGAVTDQLGHATLTYMAGATAGTDTLQAYVNQDTNATNTINADAGEPQSTTSIAVANEPAGLVLTSNQDAGTAVPTTQGSTPVTYTLKDGTGKPAAGLTVNFAVDPASNPATKAYTLSAASATTDANGQVTVTVTNPAPAAGDKITVDASIAGDAAVNDNKVTLTYQVAAASTLTLTPGRQTLAGGSQVTETATVVDQFGKPVVGQSVAFTVAGRNGPATNTQASGSATTDANGMATFTYKDAGAAVTTANQAAATDTVTATSGGATLTAGIQFVAGTATTSTLTITPAQPITVGTTANPTAGNAAPTVTPISASPVDANGNILYGKTVTFTSGGVGSFADMTTGAATGNTATATVGANGLATVYVRSAVTGTERVTATADGVSSASATINYTNDYVAVTPDRVLDTRTGAGGAFSAGGGVAPVGPLAPNTSYGFSYAASQMPLNASAYVFNVTAISPSGLGNLRVAPANGTNNTTGNPSAAPSTSIVNYQPGKDVANLVVVPNTGGSNVLQLFSAASAANVAIDLVGYYPQQSTGINAGTPTRLADTRSDGNPVAANTTRSFQVVPAVAAGAPQPVKSVALNVTAIDPKGLGNLRIFADGTAVPTTSNINYIPGQDKSATVIVNVPANGKIDVYSAGSSVDVAVDGYATYPAASSTVTQTPVRILDTRTATPLAAGGSVNVQIGGVAGVPADAQAVLVSVTGIHTKGSTGVGNLRAYPAGGTLPNVSTLNYVSPTSDVANFAIVKLGVNGQITLNTQGSPIDATVDVVGYVPSAAPVVPAG